MKLNKKIGYGLGDTASCLVFGLEQSILQKYYTDILGLEIVNILILFVVARIWDAINDPLWGRIVDSITIREDGRYRHWIRVMAIPTAVSAVLMFVKIPGLTATQYYIYACITYIMFGMIYTMINIPYGSLAQVMADDENDRSSLSVFRSIGSTLGALPAMLLVSFCYVTNEDGFKVMSHSYILIGACIIALVSVVCYFICYKNTEEKISVKNKIVTHKTHQIIRILLHSKPFVLVSITGMLFLAAQMFGQSYYPYLFNYYFNAPNLTMLPTVCQYLPIAIVLLFMSKLIKRMNKVKLCAYGALLTSISNLLILIFGHNDVRIFLAGCLLSGFGFAFIFLLIWALAADAIEFTENKFKINESATCYACFTFIRKLGQTIAVVLVNIPLLRIGYTDNVLNRTGLTSHVLSTMFTSSVLIPAVLFGFIFIALMALNRFNKMIMR